MKKIGNNLFMTGNQIKDKSTYAFTLVELIVVVTILAILSTIGFVSYSSYLTGVRDTNRLAQLVSIHDGLTLYSTRNDLPLPDDNVSVSVNSEQIAYQGTAGVNVLETIDFTKGGKDPKDDVYFSYYVTKSRNHFQLMAFLEESESLSFVGMTHAADYSSRIPTVSGKKLGIITNDQNIPLEQLGSDLNITPSTNGYIAHMSDDTKISGTEIIQVNPKKSCKRLKDFSGIRKDGFYDINPDGLGDIKVYCDMNTQGGGWTALLRINPSIKNTVGWQNDLGTVDGSHYNYLNKASSFEQNEIYVNKDLGYDGKEYVFEKVGGDLYARRGPLKGVLVSVSWPGLNGAMTNWIGGVHDGDGFDHGGVNYPWLLHTNASTTGTPYYDFPFYDPSIAPLSDSPWGGRYFDENVTVYIFVR